MSKPEKSLDQFRVEIDSIDQRLVRLLNDRAKLDIERTKLKRKSNSETEAGAVSLVATDDPLERQKTNFDFITSRNQGPIPNSALEGVYREILNAAFLLARPIRVGYLGPQGTFSHIAASKHFGEQVDYENLRALEGVFEEVARGHVDYGLVPIENSTGGAIIETLDAFANYFGRLTIHSEIRLPIQFSLYGNCEVENIRAVYSKAEALAQCSEWLTKNCPNAERIPWQSTADAVRHAKLVDPQGTDGVTAIASKEASDFSLTTLSEGIENYSDNVTRFLVLSRNETNPTSNDKTSLMFTCADHAGSLVDVLAVFKRYEINLSHIEKRPSREMGSEYTFFVDMLGHAKDSKTAEILGEIRAHCKSLFVLGSFPVFDEQSKYEHSSSSSQYSAIDPLKTAIDDLDTALVGLINDRAKLVVQVGEFKRKSGVPIYAPHREAAVLNKIKSLNKGPLQDKTLESIYRELMSGSFALEKPLSISFLGPEGEFSHLAAVRHFGSSVEFNASREIREVFQQVADQRADYGLVPIENSSSGGINATLDEFIGDMHEKVNIYGEVKLQTHLCLLASCRPEQVTTIYSTPEVFQQCRHWLSTQYPQAERIRTQTAAYATRQAKLEIEKNPDSGAAAIGSLLAGEIYDLKPLFSAIEDRQSNLTRFLILSKSQTQASGRDKTSLMFTTVDRSGALVDVLEIFKRNSINLTHIEKRPSREQNWDYTFFLDLEGHREDAKIAQIIGEARAHCKNLTVLGSFPVCQRVL